MDHDPGLCSIPTPPHLTLAITLFCSGSLPAFSTGAAGGDDFGPGVDLGKVELPGGTQVLPNKAGYRITGSGHNMWAKDDAFQFAARKVSGDLVFRVDVEWVGEGKAKHRKACAMVRQSLNADVAVHGDGLIAPYPISQSVARTVCNVPLPSPFPDSR